MTDEDDKAKAVRALVECVGSSPTPASTAHRIVFIEGVVVEPRPEGLRIRVVDYHARPVTLPWTFVEEQLDKRGKCVETEGDLFGFDGAGI